jgi:hypothetical protein
MTAGSTRHHATGLIPGMQGRKVTPAQPDGPMRGRPLPPAKGFGIGRGEPAKSLIKSNLDWPPASSYPAVHRRAAEPNSTIGPRTSAPLSGK